MPAVTNAHYAREYYNRCRSERGGVVGFSDSNSLQGGHGWDSGMEIAMKSKFGLWAIAPMTEVGMENHGYYWRAKPTVQSGCSSTDIVAALADEFDWGTDYEPFGDTGTGRKFTWVRQDTAGTPLGTTRSDVFGIEMGVAVAEFPFDVTAALKFHMQVAEFNESTAYNDEGTSGIGAHVAGTYRPGLRLPATAGSETSLVTLQTCSLSSGGPGSETWLDKVFDVTAGQVNQSSVQFMPGSRSVFDLKSDLAIGYMSIEKTGATSGVRCATLMQEGGSSLYDCAISLQNAHANALTNFFSRMYLQPNAAVPTAGPLLIRICFGTNDQNEVANDALAGAAVSSTEDGYYYNLVAIYNEIAATMVAIGANLSNIYIEVVPTPRLDSTHLAYHRLYANAAARFARDYSNPAGIKIWATDYEYIVDNAYLVANYYGSGGTDAAHGTSAAAYADLITKAINAAMREGVRRRKTRRLRAIGQI